MTVITFAHVPYKISTETYNVTIKFVFARAKLKWL